MLKLLPKQMDFFSIFEQTASNLQMGAKLLVELMENLSDAEEKAKKIYDAEQEGDILTHEVFKRLNKTFITPIDREDIHALSSRLDDILDLIWATAERIVAFKIKEPIPEAIALSKTLLSTTEIILKAVTSLKQKNYSYLHEYCIEINTLENRADRFFRDALAKLFDDINDPIFIIKWKEVYEHLENATDKCEDVADILEGIVLKHA
ncbi:MAG: DUF47 family protein [Nitrospirota bacterium]